MNILRINMTTLTCTLEDLPEAWRILGGRGLSARILNTEVPPDTDPLSPEARLIFATGPLAGTMAASFGRMSVGAKSPLTMGIKESNVGGTVSQKLDKLGIRAVVVEGAAQTGDLYIAKITKKGITLEPAGDVTGTGNYALFKALHSEHGRKTGIIGIGLAGERRYKSASIAVSDKAGLPSRHAARGGLGAVMGAKGLKAIVVDDKRASIIAPAHKSEFRDTLHGWADAVEEDAAWLSELGTPGAMQPLTSIGSTAMQNYSGVAPEGIEGLYGDTIRTLGEERGGKTDNCMQGCLVNCSVIHNDADGKHVTSALEYETLALMGSNLGIVDADAVARFDHRCDDLGVDTTEVGSALGIAAGAGRFAFGDVEAVDTLLDGITEGTSDGIMIASGVVATAKALGVNRVPAFKGQAMPGHDARIGKPTGVTYHTSPMGADHTAGMAYITEDEGAVEISLQAQIMNAMADTLGMCQFAIPDDRNVLVNYLVSLLNDCYDLDLNQDDIVELGRGTLRDEITFNRGAEINDIDSGPGFIRTEALPPLDMVFGVDPAEMAKIWDNLDTVKVL